MNGEIVARRLREARRSERYYRRWSIVDLAAGVYAGRVAQVQEQSQHYGTAVNWGFVAGAAGLLVVNNVLQTLSASRTAAALETSAPGELPLEEEIIPLPRNGTSGGGVYDQETDSYV